MKVMVIGDSHGNSKQMNYWLNLAGERKISHVVSVGDFGLWTHEMNGHVFLDETQKYAEANNLSVYAIGGNHENWDHWEHFVKTMPTHKGFAIVRSRVLLAPKVHAWIWDKKQFFGAGGAVSIDADFRRMMERGDPRLWDHYGMKVKATGPRTRWWDNEQLTEDDVTDIANHACVRQGEVKYMFSHDCSNLTPFRDRLKPDPDSEIHRKRMDKVLGLVKPKIHFHGHMHTKYDWVNTLGTGMFGSEPEVEIQTYGLEADFDAMRWPAGRMSGLDNWGVLDTDTDTFAFKGEGMKFRALEAKQHVDDRAFIIKKSAV